MTIGDHPDPIHDETAQEINNPKQLSKKAKEEIIVSSPDEFGIKSEVDFKNLSEN